MTTASQRLAALEHGNAVRLSRSRARRALREMPPEAALREVAAIIAEPDGVFAGMPVRRLLTAPAKVGEWKAGRWLAAADVLLPETRVGSLTDRQRKALVGLVEGRKPVVATWRARAVEAERQVEILRRQLDRARETLRDLAPKEPVLIASEALPRVLPAGVLCDWVQRHRLGYESAEAMAAAWGVSYQTVTELLRGETTRISLTVADRILSRHGGYRLEDLWPELERDAA